MSFRIGQEVVFWDLKNIGPDSIVPKYLEVVVLLKPDYWYPHCWNVKGYEYNKKGIMQAFQSFRFRPLDEVLGEIEITEVIEIVNPDKLVKI